MATKILDLDQCEGKTVSVTFEDGSEAYIAFTDGTYVTIGSVPCCDDYEIEISNCTPSDQILVLLELMTQEEANARRDALLAQDQVRTKEWRRQQYEELRKEFGNEAD